MNDWLGSVVMVNGWLLVSDFGAAAGEDEACLVGIEELFVYGKPGEKCGLG